MTLHLSHAVFRWASVIILVFLEQSLTVTTSNCDISPLVLSIRNVTFPDGIAENRGVEVLLGNQTQGLRLSCNINNTRVRNARDCPQEETQLSVCMGASGSIYNTSGSFDPVSVSSWNVTHVDDYPQGSTVVQGYDDAVFPDGPAEISDFPIEVWADATAPNKSALALGPSSSVLERLVDNLLAPSTIFGLFYGSRSQNFGQDGELVLGGYNEARINGSLTNFTMWDAGMTIPCPLQVYLTDVVLSNANGSFSLFADPGAKVAACIDPLQAAFTFTRAMWRIWANLTTHIDSPETVLRISRPKLIRPIGNL